MKTICLLVLGVVLVGCKGSDRKSARARAQGMAIGRQQATAAVQAQPVFAPITVNGKVRNKQILWSEGMTLSKAIVAADYYDLLDPLAIYVIRGGQSTFINPKDVLNQQNDPEVMPGDLIDIRR